MSRPLRRLRLGPACVLLLLALAGCGGGPGSASQAPPAETSQAASPNPAPVEIKTSAEAQPYRASIAPAEEVAWAEGATAQPGTDSPEAQRAVAEAIQANGDRLAALDYPALSLPDFVTQTRALKLDAGNFRASDLYLDAYGEGKTSGKRWAIYGWRGPEFPQHPERPLVTRWTQLFALYDLDNKRVERLLATIMGQVLE